MSDTKDSTTPTPDEAKDALSAVELMQATGLKRGIYPRKFALACSLWAGALAASLGTGWLLVVLFSGLGAYHFWRQRHTEAWVNEIQSSHDLRKVLLLSVLVGGCFLGALAALESGIAWAPYVAGILIAAILYSMMEYSNRGYWNSANSNPSSN